MTCDRWLNKTHVGDCRDLMRQMIADGVRVQTVVTSPPYYALRDYGVRGQLGLEANPTRYLARMRSVFRHVRELLADDGTLWLNMGDSYVTRPNGGIGQNSKLSGKKTPHVGYRRANGLRSKARLVGFKHKDLIGMPWLLAFTLRADGWYLRSDIIWHKPNPMPSSVEDRPTLAHEYMFLLSKSGRYFYDADAIREESVYGYRNNPNAAAMTGRKASSSAMWRNAGDGATAVERGQDQTAATYDENHMRNKRTVWTVPTRGFEGAHFATFPEKLIEPCILAGSRPGDIVFDPFMGSGTVAKVATDLGRQFIGCELNPSYLALHEERRTTMGLPL